MKLITISYPESMKKLISQNTLDLFYREQLKEKGKGHIEWVKQEQKEKKNLKYNTSIFLCHSHLDKTIVNKIILLFNKLGVDIYVDWMDTTLPVKTDKDTATAIKSKIEDSNKFLFLATYKAVKSRWCSWELGLAYSSKGEKDFAILPIESRSGNWPGSEYLQLYPEMMMDIQDEKIKSLAPDNIVIKYPNGNSISLIEWLTFAK